MADGSDASLLRVLDVPRRAAAGFGLGGALAALLYVFFVVVPGSPNPLRYLALAFVVAVTLGLVVTAALVAHRAYRLGTAEG